MGKASSTKGTKEHEEKDKKGKRNMVNRGCTQRGMAATKAREEETLDHECHELDELHESHS